MKDVSFSFISKTIKDLECGGRKDISLEELRQAYEETKGSDPNVRAAYEFLKSQRRMCPKCNTESTVRKLKYILPCNCVVCPYCLDAGAKVLVSGLPKQENELKCKEHNLPFYPERILDVVSKVKVHSKDTSSIRSFFGESTV